MAAEAARPDTRIPLPRPIPTPLCQLNGCVPSDFFVFLVFFVVNSPGSLSRFQHCSIPAHPCALPPT